MKHNGHHSNEHGHATETPDTSHIRNVDVTHELSDVNVEGVVKFLIGLTIMTVVTFGLMWVLFLVLNREQEKKDVENGPGPMAMTEKERLPPEPRLQEAPGFGVKLENGQFVDLNAHTSPAHPQAEYQQLRQQWLNTLEKGKTDSSGKTSALPIEEAMQKVLDDRKLLPVNPNTNTNKDDLSISAPTAASSGRYWEKRQ